jgi:hypothetical protein
MSESDIATYLRQRKSTIIRFLNAYSFMSEKFLTIDNGKYATDG